MSTKYQDAGIKFDCIGKINLSPIASKVGTRWDSSGTYYRVFYPQVFSVDLLRATSLTLGTTTLGSPAVTNIIPVPTSDYSITLRLKRV